MIIIMGKKYCSFDLELFCMYMITFCLGTLANKRTDPKTEADLIFRGFSAINSRIYCGKSADEKQNLLRFWGQGFP